MIFHFRSARKFFIFMSKKISVILICACAVFGILFVLIGDKAFLNRTSPTESTQNKTDDIVENSPQIDLPEKLKVQSPAKSAPDNTVIQPDNSSAVSSSDDQKIKVSFTAGEFSRSFDIPADSTAYDLMTELASTTDFAFKSRYYSGLGYFVQEINGRPNAGGAYWTLYVNGKYSNVGASQYKLQPGDAVEWRYEKQ